MRRSTERNDTFVMTAFLAYTGGGTIELFVISYREVGADIWIVLERNFTAIPLENSMLAWSTEITNDTFQDSAFELQVEAVNTYGYASNSVDGEEEISKSVLTLTGRTLPTAFCFCNNNLLVKDPHLNKRKFGKNHQCYKHYSLSAISSGKVSSNILTTSFAFVQLKTLYQIAI